MPPSTDDLPGRQPPRRERRQSGTGGKRGKQATGEEISVSAVDRAAGVDRSFLYRHHDLRAQIHARAADPAPTPVSAKASRQSLLADIANLRDQAQRLRRQNASLTARLSELLGQEAFRASGLGNTERD